ncbi:RHS repeat-associated core domain-containing protein [Rugosimonospora acidiphila]|uniref:RHS repeat-associated core domain-containing protein n=1 Tax=Rugosimonospora acidiphila TaxID=556531 RepID=A0ABP9SLW3_9ACTN
MINVADENGFDMGVRRTRLLFDSGTTERRGWHRWRDLLSGVTVLAMVAAVLAGIPPTAAVAKDRFSPPPLPKTRAVPVTPVKSHYQKPKPMPQWQPSAIVWPSGSADATLTSTAVESSAAAGTSPAGLTSAGSASASPKVRAGSLPVWLGPPTAKPAGRDAKAVADTDGTAAGVAKVHVDVAPQAAATAAGIHGVILSLSRSDGGTAPGEVHVMLSYAQFQDAFGGDWGSRLRLRALPACAVSTPATPSCRVETAVTFTNDVSSQMLQADVTIPAATAGQRAGTMVLAADASGDSGGGGDFTATSLSTSGTWSAGGAGDSFDWSYPITVPDVPGDLTPQIALSYDSQSQDGLTSSTNNQASWIGDGWDYSPGYIERSYPSCNDNPKGPTKTGDSCWSDSANTLTMSLGSSSSQLVKDDKTGIYHPQNDTNEKVELLSGAPNGAYNGEYWRITTADGIQYYFGKNQLPGYASGDTATNSVYTEPVFFTSQVTGRESCYNATFVKSFCQDAYRWNLDYVVDTHHDTIAYYYHPETNYYSTDSGTTANASYVRGGYLEKIAYGQRDGQVYTTQPAAQVLFATNGRCDTSDTGCDTSTLTSTTASHWPDVPFDENCANKAACANVSPTFWTESMLTGIQTQALVNGTETNVDSWSLKHSLPPTGDSTKPSLWLSSITRTGQDTTAAPGSSTIPLPTVTFTGRGMANRVAANDGNLPITRQRMYEIDTETGEKISINYSTAVCPTCVPSDPSHNTTLAYPDYWTRDGQSDPSLDWFNKYVVTDVTQQDPTGGAANDDIITKYTPDGSPAWHYNDDPTTPTSRRTWDQWRGYAGMSVSTGTAPDPVTKTTYKYLQGMDGDTLSASSTRSVSVTDSRGDSVRDLNQYSGMTYETQVFNGSDIVTDTITDPYTSVATASHTYDPSTGLPASQAFHTGTAKTRVYTPLADGTTRETETDTSYDGYGRPVKVDDKGDVNTSSDDLCTTTSYADSTTAWILDLDSEVSTVSVDCSTTASVPDDVVSDDQTFYDNSTTLGAAPTLGDVTMTKEVASYTGSTPNYITTQTLRVDQYGRTTSSTDADNHTTLTAYTPSSGAQPTQIATLDPMHLKTTTQYDPLRNLPTTVTDPAGYLTTEQYDALGRLTAVYKPGNPVGTGKPNLKYSYTVSSTGPSVEDTYTLNHDGSAYALSETLYDSMLRARETQVETPSNGRTITDTIYNSDGWQSQVAGPYFDPNPVSTTLVQAQAGLVDSITGYLYDPAGRTKAEIASTRGTQTWQTTYIYGGNFTTTIPPAGATPTTTVTDARGNTTDLIQYHAGVSPDYLHRSADTFDDTRYTYYPDGNQHTEVDPAGNSWSWQYNLRGQQTQSNDPDTGQSTTTYDNADQLLTTTDSQGHQTTYTYNPDGQKTGAYDTTATQTLSTGNAIATWTYDAQGRPSATTSYSDGDIYTSTIAGYNPQDQPTGNKITLTGTDAALVPSSGYSFGYGYTYNGMRDEEDDPTTGDLPAEDLTYGYDNLDEPTSLDSPALPGGVAWDYVSAVGYDEFGKPLRYTFGPSTNRVLADMTYDPQTQALTKISTSTDAAGLIDDVSYTFGNSDVSKGAGLLTKTVDKYNGGTTVDTQCYQYDYAQRLQQAWTATDSCAADPDSNSGSSVGGPVAPYWQSWTYDTAGNRQTETDHDTTGNSTQDTVTTYQYPAAGSATDQPHTLRSTTVAGPSATAATYSYDTSGETRRITGGTLGDQTLTWNDQGRLATDTTIAGTTSYVYDGDGNLLVRRDPGSTTLYLGDEQVVLNGSGKLDATRYYTMNGATIAARTGTSNPDYLIPDRQGTDQLSIASDTEAVTRRQYLPFGQVRGTAPTAWPGDKGFVGGDQDATTSLENLGAREYDASTGRFLSADPVFEAGDPTQLNGYGYAGNNPVTRSDPSGETGRPCPDGDCSVPPANPNGAYECKQGCTNGHPSDPKTPDPGKSTSHPTKKKKKGLFSRVVKSSLLKHVAHAVYKYSGAESVVDCATNPTLGSCIQAGLMVGALIATGGESAFADAAIEGAADALLDGVADAALDDVVDDVGTAALDDAGSAAADDAGSAAEGADGGEGESGGGNRGSCFTNSFTPDTKVLMADGSSKPLAEVKVGDKVAAADPTTGATSAKQVTLLHDNNDVLLTDLTVTDHSGRSWVVQTTQYHPFWDPTKQIWINAGALPIGSKLATVGGHSAWVTAVHNYTATRRMLDLTVATLHTFYVEAGTTPVLVHNEDCGSYSARHRAPDDRRGGTVAPRPRAGDETAEDAGETDEAINNAIDGTNNVSTITSTSINNLPGPIQLPEPASPDASVGGLIAVGVMIFKVAWGAIRG